MPLDGHSPFIGDPRPELDEAWHSILKCTVSTNLQSCPSLTTSLDTNIRIDDDTLSKINKTSIPLNDGGGGYLAALDVHHELHCLNELRKQIYRDQYPDKHSKEKQLQHANHCIDILRQVLMCHGDVSIQVYDWIDDYRWPWPNFNTAHTCRKWDAINGWAGDHFVPTLRGSVLVHPSLGKLTARRLVREHSTNVIFSRRVLSRRRNYVNTILKLLVC